MKLTDKDFKKLQTRMESLRRELELARAQLKDANLVANFYAAGQSWERGESGVFSRIKSDDLGEGFTGGQVGGKLAREYKVKWRVL